MGISTRDQIQLSFAPISWVDGRVRWLDQTALPTEENYRETDNFEDIVGAIKRLEVRGAPLIGIAGAYAIALAAQSEIDDDSFRRAARMIREARPTAVNLAWAVDRVMKRIDGLSDDERSATALGEARSIHDEDKELCRKIGAFGDVLIPDGATVLTHCNTGALATGGIGTAAAALYTAHHGGKQIKVYADETRPLLQGARLTTWELQKEGIDVTLITDSMAGSLMCQEKIDCVIVGADRIAKNGDVANKIGTYSLAVLAKHHDIPFYVAAPYSTFDDSIAAGDDIAIEERAAAEVSEGFGRRTAPEVVKVYNPAFDITPRDLVSKYISDKGVTDGGRS